MRQIELDFAAAIDLADRLAGRPGFAFLDSAMPTGETGRWSFVAIEPFGTFLVRDGTAFWNGEALAGPPLDRLREALARYRLDDDGNSSAPFRGGCIGFVSYDFGTRLEGLPEPASMPAAGEELLFRFYDVVLAFDHQGGRSVLFSSGLPEADGHRRAARAEARAEHVLTLLRNGVESEAAPVQPVGPWRSNFTAKAYEAAVERVRAFIAAGDIYQANIAQRFEAALPPGFDHWQFYKRLRQTNPAPFGAFLALDGGRSIASSSPERFLLCRNGAVEARPIKGTASRSADPAEDAELARALAASEKDRAENVMIVDLLRNDLSRVCEPGSVAVPMLCGLETFASVHHLTSIVTGRLRRGLDALDLFAAAFPCGSITGAPKRRAMEIIAAIEGGGRGVYCGAIGWLGFDGAMDMNVAIRTVALEPDVARLGAGGGVTLLSDPQGEYRETMVKAERILEAFGSADPPCSS